jgi:hypothetical protein
MSYGASVAASRPELGIASTDQNPGYDKYSFCWQFAPQHSDHRRFLWMFHEVAGGRYNGVGRVSCLPHSLSSKITR